MSSKEECGAYFRAQKELNRLFEAMRRKWQSYGRCAGVVQLRGCELGERKALEKMLGRAFPETDVKISLPQVEKALQDTRFAPISLKELLEAYFQEEMVTNNRKRQEKQQRREVFFQEVDRYFRGQGPDQCQGQGFPCQWFSHMYREQKYGYSLLIREQERDPAAAFRLAQNAGRALAWTQEKSQGEIPIAVLAARITGNPHYFDRGTTAGTLLVHGFCFSQKREYPQSAYQWKELLVDAGILPDDVASTVITYGVHLKKRGELHPAVEAFYQMKEPVTLTSINLLESELASGEEGRAYVVENEMVFRYLYEKIKNHKITLLCTSGQMRTAALELIRLLVQGNTRIYYSGDMDPEGLGIADRIWKKYPQDVCIWRMCPNDYKRGLSQEKLEARSLSLLEAVEHPELARTAELIKKEKRAAYQENLLQELLRDLLGEG